jgi:hypothetical protein
MQQTRLAPQGLRGSPGGLRSLTTRKGGCTTARLDTAPYPPADRGLLFQLAEMAFAAKGGWDATRVLDARHHRVFVARDDGPAGYVAVRSSGGIRAPDCCRE